jgi:hypothetical protein
MAPKSIGPLSRIAIICGSSFSSCRMWASQNGDVRRRCRPSPFDAGGGEARPIRSRQHTRRPRRLISRIRSAVPLGEGRRESPPTPRHRVLCPATRRVARYCPTRRRSENHSQFGRLRDSPVLGLADRWEAIRRAKLTFIGLRQCGSSNLSLGGEVFCDL